MDKLRYADNYRNINFRKHPNLYRIGRGEQGVLIAEPYKSEILPHWKFATKTAATKSAKKIYEMFKQYKKQHDFVGMDMARKFLQMGFTRARRYANHKDGRKYSQERTVLSQEKDWQTSEKARSAAIFYLYYKKAKDDPVYKKSVEKHKEKNRLLSFK